MGFTVAIDGPAAAGKGTIARALADRFRLAYLDTGSLYRAVGAKVQDGMTPLDAARGLCPADLSRDDLRSAEAGQAASQVAALPDVRAALVDFQRAFAAQEGGAVLDGRDIGTVICPDAQVKLFITASAQVRTQRRLAELRAAGSDIGFKELLKQVQDRDHRDSTRADAPLRPADDAVLIDTTDMDIQTAIAAAADVIAAKRL